MSSKDTSVKNRTSASGNEPTAELKNQVLENEMKLNEVSALRLVDKSHGVLVFKLLFSSSSISLLKL